MHRISEILDAHERNAGYYIDTSPENALMSFLRDPHSRPDGEETAAHVFADETKDLSEPQLRSWVAGYLLAKECFQ